MAFAQGDNVVYPNHGVAIIEDIAELRVGEFSSSCYRLRLLSNGTMVIVPQANADSVGLRPPIGKREVKSVFKTLRSKSTTANGNWRGRFKENSERLRTGQLIDVAAVLRSLSTLAESRSLSFREKKMLDKARDLVVSEIAAVQSQTADKVSALVETALTTKPN